VRSRRRRSLVVVVLAAGLGVVFSACGGPVQATSAAIVGDTGIPLRDVQSRLDYALSRHDLVAQIEQQGNGPADLSRELVTRSVLHTLLEKAAVREGINPSPSAVADGVAVEQRRVAGQDSFEDPAAVPERVRDQLIAAELGRRYIGGLSVTIDATTAVSRSDAADKARRIASGPDGARAVFAAAGQDAQLGLRFRAASDPETATSVLFGMTTGKVVYFQPSSSQAGWVVVRVTDRRTNSTPAPGDPPDVPISQIASDNLQMIGFRLLQPLAEELGVRINPRYGVWDGVQLRAVAEADVRGEVLPAPAR
jgi:hypothetical protein